MSNRGAFDGKVAVVTGASQGIGRAIAQRLSQRGAAVALNYPNEDEAERAHAIVRELECGGGKAVALKADIRHLSDINYLFEAADKNFGALDFVISNAGGPVGVSHILDCDEKLFDAATVFNAKSAFFVMKEAARRLREGGRVVAISSSTTQVPQAGLAPYAGAKAAVEAYCRILARELGPRGITVNSVSPGLTDTEGMRAARIPVEQINAVIAMTASGRLGEAQDVADVVMMLLGDDARWITGQHIAACGGAFH